MFFILLLSFEFVHTSSIFGDVLIPSEKVPISNDTIIENVSDIPEENYEKIVGGVETDIEKRPYQVALILDNKYFCGGFIISENYVLTAAHCAEGIAPENVTMRIGSSWRRNGTIVPISEVWTHPEYGQPTFDKDVAVLKTASPLEFNDRVQPVKLPPLGRPMVGSTDIDVSGWGRTQQGAPTIPERLMEVTIPVVNYYQCFLSYYAYLTKNMFCAGNFFLGGKGTCQGDSGGAAVQDGYCVGIVSFGRGCAQPLSPSVFANIAQPDIRNFIREHTGL
ncbi:trypsin-3-like [Achroia grisella]|uniref:trypsin-3-like n=1 Tax=Achroia grisella TaxID=688607 RepID=UPI0027D2DB78|nr:trypsin-3-like [Achroia grisella]